MQKINAVKNNIGDFYTGSEHHPTSSSKLFLELHYKQYPSLNPEEQIYTTPE